MPARLWQVHKSGHRTTGRSVKTQESLAKRAYAPSSCALTCPSQACEDRLSSMAVRGRPSTDCTANGAQAPNRGAKTPWLSAEHTMSGRAGRRQDLLPASATSSYALTCAAPTVGLLDPKSDARQEGLGIGRATASLGQRRGGQGRHGWLWLPAPCCDRSGAPSAGRNQSPKTLGPRSLPGLGLRPWCSSRVLLCGLP